MKRLVVVIFASLFAISTFAQDKGGKKEHRQRHTPEQRAEKIANGLKSRLDLTDSQTVVVKTIALDAAQQRMTVKADTALDKDARKEKLKTINTDTDNKIKAVLTTEQQAKYDQMKKEKKEMKEEGKVKNKKNKKKGRMVTPDENGKAGYRKNKN